MATFLQLAQKLASESGTVSGSTQPASVTGLSGRLEKIVRWTNDAWNSIQTAHNNWRWMQSTFTGPTIASQQEYQGSDFSLSRFGDWIYSGESDEQRLSLYDPSVGVAEEGSLRYLDWDTFFVTRMRGAHTTTTDKPQFFTISPENKLLLSPIPDKAYTLRGLYQKNPQTLTAGTDVPEMPAHYHDLIVEVGLLYLGNHDESMNQIQLWNLRKVTRFNELERDQLPQVRFPETFA